jgi:hypothetical protein
MTPSRVLWYSVAGISWFFLTLALFIPLITNPSLWPTTYINPSAALPALGCISTAVGLVVGVYTVFKQYEAPRQWLRSYLDQDMPEWISIFATEERLTKKLKAATLVQQLLVRWRNYSLPRQDRWNRSVEDLMTREELNITHGDTATKLRDAGDGILGCGYIINMDAAVQQRSVRRPVYKLVDEKYADLLWELETMLQKLGAFLTIDDTP